MTQENEVTHSTTNTAALVCSYPQCNCPFDAPADPNWCARGLPRTLTQQGGGEQEARNLVENFEELVSDCHNGDETGWASPRERDRIRANRIAAREELIAALRTPTAEVGIGDEARLRDYPKLLAFFSKHALGTLTAPSCLCCGQSTQGVEIGVQHLELPAIVICAPCHTAALQAGTP